MKVQLEMNKNILHLFFLLFLGNPHMKILLVYHFGLYVYIPHHVKFWGAQTLRSVFSGGGGGNFIPPPHPLKLFLEPIIIRVEEN